MFRTILMVRIVWQFEKLLNLPSGGIFLLQVLKFANETIQQYNTQKLNIIFEGLRMMGHNI